MLEVCSNLIMHSTVKEHGKLRWAAKINAICNSTPLHLSERVYLQDSVGFIYVCPIVYVHNCLCMSTWAIPGIISLAFTVMCLMSPTDCSEKMVVTYLESG